MLSPSAAPWHLKLEVSKSAIIYSCKTNRLQNLSQAENRDTGVCAQIRKYFGAPNSYFTFLGYTVVWTLKQGFEKEEEMMAKWRSHGMLS